MIIAKTDRLQARIEYIRLAYDHGVRNASIRYNSFEGTDEEKLELWSMLDSWIRSAIKREANEPD